MKHCQTGVLFLLPVKVNERDSGVHTTKRLENKADLFTRGHEDENFGLKMCLDE